MRRSEIVFFEAWLTLSWRRPLSYRNRFLYDNVLRHERVKDFFLFQGKVSFLLKYSTFYTLNHFINWENCNTMISISTRGRVRFWLNLLNLKSFDYETRLTNMVIDNILRKSSHGFKDWVLNPILFTNIL